jgi:hypothetical protein
VARRFEITESVADAVTGRPVSAATVQVLDLAGNELTLWTSEGGVGTTGNPTSSGNRGQIDGDGTGVWVDAPDYDLVISRGGQSYTQRVRVGRTYDVCSYGAKGDGATDDSAAFIAARAAAGANGTITAPDGVFKIGTMPFTGATSLKFTGAGKGRTIIDLYGVNLAQIVGPALGSSKALTASVTVGDTTLQLPTSGLATGDYLILRDSDQHVFGTAASPYDGRVGEVVRVKSIDSVSALTLYGQVEQAMPLASGNLTVRKLNLVADIEISDMTIRNPNPATYSGGNARAIWITRGEGFRSSNVEFIGLDDDAYHLDNVIGFRIESPDFLNLTNSGGRTPYGIACQNATCDGQIIAPFQRYGRHVVTSGGDDGEIGPAHIKVTSGLAMESSSSPWDSHPPGRYFTFENCKAHACGGAGGFQIRAPYTLVINPQVTAGTIGVHLGGTALRSIVSGGDLREVTEGIRIEANDCRVKGNPRIKANTHAVRVFANTDIPSAGSPAITDAYIGVIDVVGDPTTGGVVLEGSGAGLVVEPPNAPSCAKPVVAASYGATGYSRRGNADLFNGQTGLTAPTSRLWVHDTLLLTANRAYHARFVPSRNLRANAVMFLLATAATNNDEVDVAILDAAGARLASAGLTLAKLNSAAPNPINVPLSAPVFLKAHTVYYVSLSCGAVGGTAATLVSALFQGDGHKTFGSAVPTVEAALTNASHPIGAAPAFSSTPEVPILIPREN